MAVEKIHKFLGEAALAQLVTEIKALDEKDQAAIAAEAQARIDQIGEIPEKVGEVETATVRAYIDAKVAALDGDSDARLDALEALHADAAEGEGMATVAEEAQAAIDGIAEASEDNGEEDLVKVTVTTKAGSVTAVEVDDSELDSALEAITDRLDVIEGDEEGSIAKAVADEAERVDNIIGDLGKVKDEDGQDTEEDQTVVGYVDAKVAEINGDADALEDRVEALEATHATKEDGSFKTVQDEVDEAIAKVVDGAPAAFDTLKEIADWIANSDDQTAADAEKLVTTVDRLDGAVTVEGSVKYQIKDAIDALDAEEVGEGDCVKVTVTQEDGVITGVAVAEDFTFITAEEVAALFNPPAEDENA